MKKVLLGLGLLCSLSANAKDCEKEGSMSAIRACLESQSSETVDTAYSNLINALKNSTEAMAAIKKAQNDWKNFRDSTCDYVATTYKEGGYGYSGDARTNCLAEFNEARVKILKRYAKETSK
jgi:uncharacterized protein YecT (DUF1311 family)